MQEITERSIDAAWNAGSLEQLRDTLRDAMAIASEVQFSSWCWAQLAEVEYELREYDRSVEAAETGLRLAPDCPELLWDVAMGYLMQGRIHRARAIWFRLAAAGDPERLSAGPYWVSPAWAASLMNDAAFRLAELEIEAGHAELASAHFDRWQAMRRRGVSTAIAMDDQNQLRRRLASWTPPKSAAGAGGRHRSLARRSVTKPRGSSWAVFFVPSPTPILQEAAKALGLLSNDQDWGFLNCEKRRIEEFAAYAVRTLEANPDALECWGTVQEFAELILWSAHEKISPDPCDDDEVRGAGALSVAESAAMRAFWRLVQGRAGAESALDWYLKPYERDSDQDRVARDRIRALLRPMGNAVTDD